MAPPSVPVTMLSGFLGAGKTTLLRYILETSPLKIGCIVNDVASVNIDAKLVRNDRNRDRTVNSTADLADTVELANGCACCSIQDELFASFEQLLALADKRGVPFDRFVLENSGVAEPANIRERFTEAIEQGAPLTARIYLDTLVTIVDAGAFLGDFASRAPLAARPELGEGGNLRPVVDLLVEQIECADFLLLNKKDMLDEDKLESLKAIVSSLNPFAQVVACQQARVDIARVFGPSARALVAQLNVEGQHRGAVAAAKAAQTRPTPAPKAVSTTNVAALRGPPAKRTANAAFPGGERDGAKPPECAEHGPGCAGGHGHGHRAGSADGAAAAGNGEREECGDDDGHAHDGKHQHAAHAHKQEGRETTAAERFGIRSFVYTRRRPFHPQRLRDMVLRWLPVAQNMALNGDAPGAGASPIRSVLRSKGFLWMSHSHTSAFYWSHAGQHFEIRDEGDWWAAVPEEDWPAEGSPREAILADFDASTDYGDRRQTELLTDEELARYRENYKSAPDPPNAAYVALRAAARGEEAAAAPGGA